MGVDLADDLRPSMAIVCASLTTTDDFDLLLAAREAIVPRGAIWAVWRKGQKALNENHVRAAALERGLVDVKVCKVSETLSGLTGIIHETSSRKLGFRSESRTRPEQRSEAIGVRY